MARQLSSLQTMTPGLFFGSTLMALALIIASKGGAAFYQLAIWGVVVALAQLTMLFIWLRNKRA